MGSRSGRSSATWRRKAQARTSSRSSSVSGSLELGAIVIAGGAGLSLGWSIVSPGELTRLASLQNDRPRDRRHRIRRGHDRSSWPPASKASGRGRRSHAGVKVAVGATFFSLVLGFILFAGRGPAAIREDESMSGLDVLRARVTFRERTLLDVLDLALRFSMVHVRDFAKLGLVVLAPSLGATIVMGRTQGWAAAWLLAVALSRRGRPLHAPCVALGVRRRRPRARRAPRVPPSDPASSSSAGRGCSASWGWRSSSSFPAAWFAAITSSRPRFSSSRRPRSVTRSFAPTASRLAPSATPSRRWSSLR